MASQVQSIQWPWSHQGESKTLFDFSLEDYNLKLRAATLTLTLMALAFSAPAFAAIHSTTGNSSSGSHTSLNAPTVLYDDGPTDGNTNAFFIDGPNSGPALQTISDGFIASASGTASSLDFGIWVPTGTTPTSVSWWLGTSAFGSEISSGSTAQVGYAFLFSNAFGFDIFTATVTGLSGNLVAGNAYWLTLGGANDSLGTQFDAWDVNGGPASCDFAVGGVPAGDCGFGIGVEGEAFTLYGSSNTGVPEPGSLMLLGSGIVGLAGIVRRKINL